MGITDPLPRPTCPLLDRTPSIKGGTVNDADVLGDIVSSLSHTRCHPQLVPPCVEVYLHITSLVRKHQILGVQVLKLTNLASLYFF